MHTTPRGRSQRWYLNSCRRKRNALSYEFAGGVTETELSEMLRKVPVLKKIVEEWLKERYPDLVR